ncbi:hypothetical protein TIFTF001_042053 [Ficus carica]|uniref:Uncharacterized protein n=1 Tax=Ficus carica TaxID=3494 RepID=A0AA88CTK0_FICCA|nr:hypothetical protein TIFTF001_042045 [Ficus carica]GMN34428.1 hypothetical protein TIFTF001_042053 [Ficus carica]
MIDYLLPRQRDRGLDFWTNRGSKRAREGDGATPEGGWTLAVPPWLRLSPRPSQAPWACEGMGSHPGQGAGGADRNTPPKELSELFLAGQE